MTKKIRYGILSFAMGHAYPWAEGVLTHPLAELSGVWDEDEQRGREAAQRFGTVFYETPAQVLAASDAVAITPTTAQHLPLVEQAARAGVHIMLEKPLAMSVAEGERMRAIVEESGIKFMLNFPKRFDDANRKLAEMVHSGRLGMITLVRIRHCHYIYRTQGNGTWFAQPQHSGGGALFDEGSHAFDQLLWLLGMPHSVYGAISSRLGLACDDTGLAVMRYADGAIGEVISSGAMIAAEDCVEVYGTEGSALLSATDMASREFARAPYFRYFLHGAERSGWIDGGVVPDFQQGYFHQKCPHHFIEYLLGRAPAIVTLEEGLNALRLAEMAYESSRLGREIVV